MSDDDIDLHDLWPQKCHILTTIRTVWGPYKRYRKAVKDHNMFSADPVAVIIQEIINNALPLVEEKHVREALDDSVNFANYTGSTDNAYRSVRNYLLKQLLDHEKELRAALEQEKQIEDYENPLKWYDNKKVILRNKRENMRKQGLLKDDEYLPEEVPYMDDIHLKMFHNQQKKRG